MVFTGDTSKEEEEQEADEEDSGLKFQLII